MLQIQEILARIAIIIKSDANEEFAKALKVKPSTSSSWKTRNTIPWDDLYAFCEERKVPFGWLLTGKDQDGLEIKNAEVKLLIQSILKEGKDAEQTLILFLRGYVMFQHFMDSMNKMSESMNRMSEAMNNLNPQQRSQGPKP
jgi:hypothetical protein